MEVKSFLDMVMESYLEFSLSFFSDTDGVIVEIAFVDVDRVSETKVGIVFGVVSGLVIGGVVLAGVIVNGVVNGTIVRVIFVVVIGDGAKIRIVFVAVVVSRGAIIGIVFGGIISEYFGDIVVGDVNETTIQFIFVDTVVGVPVDVVGRVVVGRGVKAEVVDKVVRLGRLVLFHFLRILLYTRKVEAVEHVPFISTTMFAIGDIIQATGIYTIAMDGIGKSNLSRVRFVCLIVVALHGEAEPCSFLFGDIGRVDLVRKFDFPSVHHRVDVLFGDFDNSVVVSLKTVGFLGRCFINKFAIGFFVNGFVE